MNIAFFEIEDWEKEYITHKLSGNAVSFFPEKLSIENVELAKNCDVIAVFIDSQVAGPVLDALPNLKMIATRSTGFDHIDIRTCKERKITVANVPFYGENTVAEHTFALILDLSRKIYYSIERAKKGNFSLDGLRGFDLKDKTIGIVGMGHIGQHVARIAQGFEMNVVGFDLHEDKKLAKKLGFTYASLEDLLKKSDIITLHLPYNEHTHHIIDAQNIGLIKKGGYIINTARGGLIETAVLVQALQEGGIAGAGLDVLEEENVIKEEVSLLSKLFSRKHNLDVVTKDHILMKMHNVMITPHNAFNSTEALKRILETTVENIQGFITHKAINIIT
jgi:D-lactate dehydrogenase